MNTIYISILSWNDAPFTLACVRSVKACTIPLGYEVHCVVVDNGSKSDDLHALTQGLVGSAGLSVESLPLPVNTGFAAGHNFVIDKAMAQDVEFIWLLNNDVLVLPDTLVKLVDTMLAAPRCGVVSPLIYAHHDKSKMDFVGAIHDWINLDSVRAADEQQAIKLQNSEPTNFFVYGTAPLIRIAAEIGRASCRERVSSKV